VTSQNEGSFSRSTGSGLAKSSLKKVRHRVIIITLSNRTARSFILNRRSRRENLIKNNIKMIRSRITIFFMRPDRMI
jgi:hypothetical protein